MDHQPEDLLSSTQAARFLGVHTASIKRWSDQGKLNCIRTPGGHRRFLRSELEAMAKPEPSSDFCHNLLQALVAGKQMAAEAILLDHWGQTSRWEHVGDDVGVMLKEMGAAWIAGRLQIAEEHVASETLMRALSRIRTMIPNRPTSPLCALATVPGDEHTLALSVCELVLAEHDWQPLWLGRFSPTEVLVDIVKRPEVNMLALSASAYSSTPQALGNLLRLLGPVALASDTELVLGGSGAWPTEVYGSHRIKTYQEFGELLRDMAASGAVA
jgi:excisionase family DNA binding protein